MTNDIFNLTDDSAFKSTKIKVERKKSNKTIINTNNILINDLFNNNNNDLNNTLLNSSLFISNLSKSNQSTINLLSNTSLCCISNDEKINDINPLISSVSDTISDEETDPFYAQNPLFFENTNKINIGKKLVAVVSKYVSKKDLKTIDEDTEVAIELCLIFLSNLSKSYFMEEDNMFVKLYSPILREQVSNKNDNTYKKIIDILLKGTTKGPIIEMKDEGNFVAGQFSRSYRLTDTYRAKGIETYTLTTNKALQLRRKQYFKRLIELQDNIITRNLIAIYATIELPTIQEINNEAKRLISINYKNKKKKILTYLGKHTRDYWKNSENRSFVEDNIELFQRLTENGFLMPSIGDENSGGRVVDSFTLMPSWIRNICKINGEYIVEADYSAMHPNIAMTVYSGYGKYITHKKIAELAGIDESDVKVEHLSFFNKRIEQMMKSPLFNYYNTYEKEMMNNLYQDKQYGKYKNTSKKLFTIEVQIMTDVIEILNEENIAVGYVYDALFCQPKHKQRVIEVMNEIALKYSVYTIAK